MLKQVYTSQAEIPDVVREHYAEKEGKWILDTDPPTEDVTGLKTALNTERGLRREAEKQVTDFKVRYEGIDPEEVQRLRDRVKGLDDAEIYDKQGIDALVNRRTQSMKDEHERVVHVKQREIEQFRAQAQAYEQRWRQDKIKTALVAAAADVGVDKRAIEDAVRRGLTVFVDVDEHDNVIAKNGEDVRYGKDGITPLTPNEWAADLKITASHLFPPSSGGGAPPNHGPHGQGIDWSKLPPTERLTKFRELQQGTPR